MNLKKLILLTLILFGLVLLTHSVQAQQVTPPVLTPEPYAFSDRYPAEVTLNSPSDLALLDQISIDVENIRQLDGTYPSPDTFKPLIA